MSSEATDVKVLRDMSQAFMLPTIRENVQSGQSYNRKQLRKSKVNRLQLSKRTKLKHKLNKKRHE